MSKIGKKPIEIPQGVEVKQQDGVLVVKGANGEQSIKLLDFVKVEMKENEINLSIEDNKKQARSNWGTLGALIRNAIQGVSEGYEKILEIEGVGYKAAQDGKGITLNLGFSHPIKYTATEGVELTVDGQNKIIVKGASKQAVGQAAAEIRAFRKPEPYKGKGVRYEGEYIRRKAGKKVGAE